MFIYLYTLFEIYIPFIHYDIFTIDKGPLYLSEVRGRALGLKRHFGK